MPYVGHQFYTEQGQGFPLVLVHGHTLDGRMWEPVAGRLAARFRVIIPDLTGHGRSGQPEQPAPLCDDLAALLDGLGIEKAAVCGLSLGGAVTVSFALHHPDRCAALIPVDAALFGHKFTEWKSTRPYTVIAQEQGLPAALEAWLAEPIFTPAVASPAASRVREMVLQYPGHAWLGSAGPMVPPGPPDAARLGEIAAPTLVVVGEHDLPDFQRIAGVLAGTIPGARKAVIAGAGHLAPLEAPEAFLAELLPFLDQIVGA